MGNSKILIGDDKMTPEEVMYFNELFKDFGENIIKVANIVSNHLDKGEMAPVHCIFTISYEAALHLSERTSSNAGEFNCTSLKVQVSYSDGTHGNLEDPPGVSYAS